MAASGKTMLESIFHHVALPPKLPNRQEAGLDTIQDSLTERLLNASIAIRDSVYERHGPEWDCVRRSISVSKSINAGGRLDKTTLVKAFRELEGNEMLIVHISEQNAALLVQKVKSTNGLTVIFESFETSASSESVLASKGALEWEFPGSAVSIPITTFNDDSFQENLASFLSQASGESIKAFAAKANKAGSFTFESRDSVNPALITGMLMTLLEALGVRYYPPVLKKRIRDDVCWADAENPWRRCPWWTVLRVASQRLLCTLFGGEDGRVHYKFLICHLISSLMDDSIGVADLEVLSYLETKLCRRLTKLEKDLQVAAMNSQETYGYFFSKLEPIFLKVSQKTSAHIEKEWAKWKAFNRRPVPPLPRYADLKHQNLALSNSGKYIQQVLDQAALNSRKGVRPTNQHYKPSKFEFSSAATQQARNFASKYFKLAQTESIIRNKILDEGGDSQAECIMSASLIDSYIDQVSDAYCHNPEQISATILLMMEVWVYMDKHCIKTIKLLEDYSPIFPAHILDVLQVATMEDLMRIQRIRTYLTERQKTSHYNMSILVDPVKDLTSAKATIFELACPKAFTVYRQSTWKIVVTFALAEELPVDNLKVRLAEYPGLQPFMKAQASRISLASTTKSFLNTHYAEPRFPVDLSNVLLPNGLRLRFYDSSTETWPGRLNQGLTFAHNCKLVVPKTSPFSMFLSTPEFQADSEGPSSYTTIASQTRAPHGLNVHEFLSAQALFSGTNRRWPQILIELGSSNLNLSTEQSALVFSHLALKAGPAHTSSHPLGEVHSIFQDVSFCERLLQQLSERLAATSSNYRETFCMETLITLILRLASLSKVKSGEAFELLCKARDITFKWMTGLRVEIQAATNIESSRNLSRYALWAAILCRRTFAIYNESCLSARLDADAMSCFVLCAITLQDNLVSDPEGLPQFLKNALIRDLKFVNCMKITLRETLQNHPSCLIKAFSTILPNFNPKPQTEPGDSEWSSSVPHLVTKATMDDNGNPGTDFTGYAVKFLMQDDDPWWVEVKLKATSFAFSQTIHFHLLEGHFFVDGKPINKLPASYRNSVVHVELFGNESFLTCPSNLPGMAYMLAIKKEGYEIHLGLREGSVFVKALNCKSKRIFEHIPRDVFRSLRGAFDLPSSLIDKCVHWLDTATGLIEIRQRPQIWRQKQSNWIIDFHRLKAYRRKSFLLDPSSPLFKNVADMFRYFESPEHLTVFQPEVGPLQVELGRLELSFSVNKRGRLESRQLRSEFDPNQDAGTWYGIMGAIVLREVAGAGQDSIPLRTRSIIVPMPSSIDSVNIKRHGYHHVSVITTNKDTHNYARYTINPVLGRLECPPEPRLLYTLAQYHAASSFIIPDPLTGRTGTEACMHLLSSGYCQPWSPLTYRSATNLIWIAQLSPQRVYYPSNMKMMQKVSWREDLPTIIQHDAFADIVASILAKSQQLSEFFGGDLLPAFKFDDRINHLVSRVSKRRRDYQPQESCYNSQPHADVRYQSRDTWSTVAPSARSNVLECATLFRTWPIKMPTVKNLLQRFQRWSEIGGYKKTFDKVLLTDLLDMDIKSEWGSLTHLLRTSTRSDSYKLMFLFGNIAFLRSDSYMDIVRTVIAFAFYKGLKDLSPPDWPAYSNFQPHQAPRFDDLMKHVQAFLIPYEENEKIKSPSPDLHLPAKDRRKLGIAQEAYKTKQRQHATELVEFLQKQWPCAEPKTEGFPTPNSIDVSQAMEIILPEWLQLYQNFKLSEHIVLVQKVLDENMTDTKLEIPEAEVPEQLLFPERCRGDEVPTLLQLLGKKGPGMAETKHINEAVSRPNPAITPISKDQVPRSTTLSPEARELSQLVTQFTASKSTVRQMYGKDLMKSLKALATVSHSPKRQTIMHQTVLDASMSAAQKATSQAYDRLLSAFELHDPRVRWLKGGRLWPSITPVTLLEFLRSSVSSYIFGSGMREALVAYAISITKLQRLMRIEEAIMKQSTPKALEEQSNLGHENWNPSERSDWLLLEIDSNILIRPGQVDVALATIDPASGANSVLQMNCGQGKTSCIMPMSAAVLADGNNLLRVIVPKPLLLQSAQTLQATLGGLLGRRITHVPFSRRTDSSQKVISAYFNLHEEIRKVSGCILAIPEHILSFKLSGLQRLSDNRLDEAEYMIKVQSWLTSNARDIMDEVDYILAVRTQLIFPSGTQKSVDGHPLRWEVIETVLKQVDLLLYTLEKKLPHSIEVVRRLQGGFPVVFFLRNDVENELISRLVEDIFRRKCSVLPDECSRSDLIAIRKFISEPRPSDAVSKRIQQLLPHKPAVRQVVYLLRGLLVHRILLMTLKKRWNVQYGLAPARDPIAVPYQAKGTPSSQAEWGHPDVSILFTCLSFYYEGLGIAHLRQILEHIVKADDPSQVYDRVSLGSTLPDSLRDWGCVNVDDEVQLVDIYKHMKYHVPAIDYFLNNFVFPRHAKQFQLKLEASGWDIPLSPSSSSIGAGTTQTPASGRIPLTTGFSGTNDSKGLLPLTIKQQDLPGLTHTNAEVLTYLLQPRNRRYEIAADHRGKRLTEIELLERFKQRGIRIFIDAGAQILEMDNKSVAETWLHIPGSSALACVYFDKGNQAKVLYRKGHEVPLIASTYADDLGDCLVYLDEAHTRGTDLKFPPTAVAALTLGMGQTKDSTVQAAMRLRQLGTTQAVVTFAPPEVHQSILDCRKKEHGEHLDSKDVIGWLLEQTCKGIEEINPLFHSQGLGYCRREQCAKDNPDFLSNKVQREAYLQGIQQPEQQSLEQFYGVRVKSKNTTPLGYFSPQLAVYVEELEKQRKGFQDTGAAVNGSALQEVEQEREVAIEVQVENVREVQNDHYQPLRFPGLHRDILTFVKTGRLAADSNAYIPALQSLQQTNLGRKHGITYFSHKTKLYVSREFTRTVEFPTARTYDHFQRNVNWVLWCPANEIAMVVIPEEAEYLLPVLRIMNPVVTHILTYSAPVTRKMLVFNELTYYSVPPLPSNFKAPMWLKIELGVFAGRLYFHYSDYEELCKYLGAHRLSNEAREEDDDDELPDSTLNKESKIVKKEKEPSTFTKKPLVFMQEWLAIRRKGQDFTHTPMGQLCQGKALKEDHPFFVMPKTSKKVDELPKGVSATRTLDVKEEDDVDDCVDDDGYGSELGPDEMCGGSESMDTDSS
ncbi:hypothetical protein HYFRA_00003516 [Hymenoscyphus fraxineus]|uniref:ubiquitinyl hydrolase 1 n=1 Tax=Hymenoscyphus fraxineus TaxID=746836 RepID=A0A9N9KSX7_9HELO|nr:hypothetical protein HYFRA_00003516 [Hymenoscyphus fraxineus]